MKEIWKDIFGYEDLYQVSNLGKIRAKERAVFNKKNELIRVNKPKELSLRNGVYLYVGLNKNRKQKQYTVHRLVAIHFIPNPENKSQINHKDGNKHNNSSKNLEWATPKENQEHSYKNGFKKPTWLGKKLSDDTIKKMSESKKGKTAHNKGKKTSVLIHGTLSGYLYHKCRCKDCKQKNTDYCKQKKLTDSAIKQLKL